MHSTVLYKSTYTVLPLPAASYIVQYCNRSTVLYKSTYTVLPLPAASYIVRYCNALYCTVQVYVLCECYDSVAKNCPCMVDLLLRTKAAALSYACPQSLVAWYSTKLVQTTQCCTQYCSGTTVMYCS